MAFVCQVDEAQEKLKRTQAKVQENLQRIAELRAEAAVLERTRSAVASAADNKPSTSYLPPASTSMRAPPQKRNMGLQSSMVLEDQLKNFWYPVEFASRMKEDLMVPIEMFNEPWVLFRDESGKASCIRDQCAHRACPLSIGRIVDGNIEVRGCHGALTVGLILFLMSSPFPPRTDRSSLSADCSAPTTGGSFAVMASASRCPRRSSVATWPWQLFHASRRMDSCGFGPDRACLRR